MKVPTQADPTTPAGGPRDIEPITLAAALLRHRRVLVLVPLTFAVISVIITLTTRRQYESDLSFMPQNADPASQMGNLAAQFGVRLGGLSEGESPAFYADLIYSRAVLKPLIERQYTVRTETGEVTGTFAQLYEIDAGSPGRTAEETLEELQSLIEVSPDDQTGIVDVDVRARWPTLSLQIAQAILEEINAFNIEMRRSRAQAEREFAEVRLEEAQRELVDAEAELRQFLESNQRGVESSPQLRITFDRLQRAVGHRQAMVTSMMQAFEQARLDEVRNTPVITVIEGPELPAQPASRGGLIRLIVATLLGLIVAGLIIAAREYMAAARAQRPDDVDAVRRLSQEALEGLPWTPLRRRRAAREG